LAGISIGSINSAIIAGSPVDQLVDNLRTFWHRVSSGLPGMFHGAKTRGVKKQGTPVKDPRKEEDSLNHLRIALQLQRK
ncbi:hypothetical protein AB9F38_36000, partial [Rhizobium leguminosarum]